jgi:hypothetical protein
LTQLPVSCHDATGVLGTTSGYVGEFSLETFDDLGQPFRSYIQTGFSDRGTSAMKSCERVLLSLKRGQTSSSTAPVATLSWRDRPGPWEEPLEVDLGESGDTHIVVDLAGLGSYRRREWRFDFTGEEELALVSATEFFEVTEA